MATFEPLLWCRRGLNRSFKKLGTLPPSHKGLQQDTDRYQGFNKLCQTCCEVLAKFVLLSFDKSNYSENPCFPMPMFSPCCLVGMPWTQGRIAEASWPTPHHLPCEWGNLIHLVSCASQHKGHCSLKRGSQEVRKAQEHGGLETRICGKRCGHDWLLEGKTGDLILPSFSQPGTGRWVVPREPRLLFCTTHPYHHPKTAAMGKVESYALCLWLEIQKMTWSILLNTFLSVCSESDVNRTNL